MPRDGADLWLAPPLHEFGNLAGPQITSLLYPISVLPSPGKRTVNRAGAGNNSERFGCWREEALSLETDVSDLRLCQRAEARMPQGKTWHIFWDLSGDAAASWHPGGSKSEDRGHDHGHRDFLSIYCIFPSFLPPSIIHSRIRDLLPSRNCFQEGFLAII